eukprot:ANDGO_04763.mRNA.1 hypothetical protein AMSG_07534
MADDDYLDQQTFQSILSSLRKQTQSELADIRGAANDTADASDNDDDLDAEIDRLYSRHKGGKTMKTVRYSSASRAKSASRNAHRPSSSSRGRPSTARHGHSKEPAMPNFYPMSKRPDVNIADADSDEESVLFRSALHAYVRDVSPGSLSQPHIHPSQMRTSSYPGNSAGDDSLALSPSPARPIASSRPQTARAWSEFFAQEQSKDKQATALSQRHRSPYAENLVKMLGTVGLSSSGSSGGVVNSSTGQLFPPRQPVRPSTSRPSPRSVVALLPRSSNASRGLGNPFSVTHLQSNMAMLQQQQSQVSKSGVTISSRNDGNSGDLQASHPSSATASHATRNGQNDSRPTTAKHSKSSSGAGKRPSSAPSTHASQRHLTQSKQKEKAKEAAIRHETAVEERVSFETLQAQIIEANDLLRTALGKPTRMFSAFRPSKSASTNTSLIRVHVYEDERLVRDLSVDMFQREYRVMRSHAQTIQAQQANSGDGKSSADQSLAGVRNGPHVMKRETKDRMRSILMDTIQLTAKLRDQIAEMDRRGANMAAYA